MTRRFRSLKHDEPGGEAPDVYKRVLDTAGLVILVAGLYFAWDQAKQFNRSQNLSNWSDVTARTFDVDKVFIDSPELQPFFFNTVDIKEGDKDYPKASAVAGLILDYFDSVMTRLEYNKDHLPDDILQRPAWNRYFKATFETSPLLCRTLTADPTIYGTEIQRIGVPVCKETFGDQHAKSVRP